MALGDGPDAKARGVTDAIVCTWPGAPVSEAAGATA